MFDIGIMEVLVIGVVGLLVFGPDRLPDMAAQAGRWVREIRGMVASVRGEVTDGLPTDLVEEVRSSYTAGRDGLARDAHDLLAEGEPAKPAAATDRARSATFDGDVAIDPDAT